MHPSVEQYLKVFQTKRCTTSILKVVYHNLIYLITSWKSQQRHIFDPALLQYEDLYDWRMTLQFYKETVLTTINQELRLRCSYYCSTTTCHLLIKNPTIKIDSGPEKLLTLSSLPTKRIDALLHSAYTESNPVLPARDEAIHLHRIECLRDLQYADEYLDLRVIPSQYNTNRRAETENQTAWSID